MRLLRRLSGYVLDLDGFSWFLSFTRTRRRLLRQQTSGNHALVTNDDSGRLPVTIHALVTKQQATRATNTAHCVRCTLCCCQATTDTTDRQTDSDFHYRCSLFPHGEKTKLGHAHTDSQRDSCVNRRTPLPTSGFVFNTLQSFQRSTLFSQGLFKASCFPTVSLINPGLSRVSNSSANTALSCFYVSRTTKRQIKVLLSLSLGLYSIRIQSPVFSDPSVI